MPRLGQIDRSILSTQNPAEAILQRNTLGLRGRQHGKHIGLSRHAFSGNGGDLSTEPLATHGQEWLCSETRWFK
jgi:hypothetical protein